MGFRNEVLWNCASSMWMGNCGSHVSYIYLYAIYCCVVVFVIIVHVTSPDSPDSFTDVWDLTFSRVNSSALALNTTQSLKMGWGDQAWWHGFGGAARRTNSQGHNNYITYISIVWVFFKSVRVCPTHRFLHSSEYLFISILSPAYYRKVI